LAGDRQAISLKNENGIHCQWQHKYTTPKIDPRICNRGNTQVLYS